MPGWVRRLVRLLFQEWFLARGLIPIFVLAGGREVGWGFRGVCTNADCVNAGQYGATDRARSTGHERLIRSELGLDAAEACAERSERPAKTSLFGRFYMR